MNELYSSFFGQGMLTGLAIAVPVGPVSILCIQRSIKQGRIAGLVSGFGASTGDAFYALISVFGLGLITTDFMAQQGWFSFLGGLLLCYLGIKTFIHHPRSGIVRSILTSENQIRCSYQLRVTWHDLFEDYTTIFALNLVNPMTILPFIAVLSGLYKGNIAAQPVYGLFFTLGVFSSGMLWRSLLSCAADWLRHHIRRHQICWINWVAGTSIMIFGLVYIYSAVSSVGKHITFEPSP